MEKEKGLNRFVKAQSDNYHLALREIKSGKKISCWMWYVFPQLKGIGKSSTSNFYGIKDREEALAYFNHGLLGKRLFDISYELFKAGGPDVKYIFGSIDSSKLHSCMTLFDTIQDETDLYKRVLNKYFNGQNCDKTITLLNAE